MLRTSGAQRRERHFKATFEIVTGQREIEDSRDQGMSPPPARPLTLTHPPPRTPQATYGTKGEVTES